MRINHIRILFVCIIALCFYSTSLWSQAVVFNELVSSNTQSLLDEDGESPDWIELYNPSGNEIDLKGFWLSDDKTELDKWSFPSLTMPPDGFLVLFASGKDHHPRHTNFRISSAGESLFLTNPEGLIVDSILLTQLPADVSFGRLADLPEQWAYFLSPTPGAANESQASDSPNPGEVIFSAKGGLYSEGLDLRLSSNQSGSEIYYTLDGSIPDENSPKATSILNIDVTSIVRARLYNNGAFSNHTVTHSYVIGKETELAVISLAAAPEDLWDGNSGIYENYKSDREIPVHLEFFTPEGQTGLSQDAGMKMFGGWSRHFPQKSFALFARSEYGVSEFDFQLFPELPFKNYEAFVLRNSGGDFDVTHIRDAMMQDLIRELNLETQAYRPVVIYLNGEYWGILNMREKLNEHYIEAHHGILKEDLEMLENNANTIHGTSHNFKSILNYVRNTDMAPEASYEYIKGKIDIDNYLDYMVSELYLANVDWPGWNLKYWRSDSPDGKWRWMVYDLDDGFGLGHPKHYGSDNMFDFATASDGDVWPNPPWSTLLFRKLLENEKFFTDFINRYADHLNTLWQPELVNQKIAHIQDEINDEMHHHLERWDLSHGDWLDEMEKLYDFSNKRVDEVHSIAISEFDLPGLAELSIRIEPAGSGSVLLNNKLSLFGTEWRGDYFMDIFLSAEASAYPGYKFEGWKRDNREYRTSKIKFKVDKNTTLTAVFSPDDMPRSPIVINEINYNSAEAFDAGDWIELYNYSKETVDVSGWRFTDNDGVFIFPDGSGIDGNSYLVLGREPQKFQTLYPESSLFPVAFDFGLSNGGEQILLLDSKGDYIDSLSYDDITPWPSMADGQGASLELNSPYSDNSKAWNWSASIDSGSPGAFNGLKNPVSNQAADLITSQPQLSSFPNPFKESTRIMLSTLEAGPLQIKVFNMMGMEVASLFEGRLEPGTHYFDWDADSNMPSGVYIGRVVGQQGSESILMMLVR